MTRGVSGGAVYNLPRSSRAIGAVLGHIDHHRFLCGSLGVNGLNELQLLEYDDDHHVVECLGIYSHKPEIWSLVAAPHEPKLVLTSHPKHGHGSPDMISLWSLPQPESCSEEKDALKEQALEGEDEDIFAEKEPVSETLESPIKEVFRADPVLQVEIQVQNLVNCMNWRPENPQHIICADRESIKLWDLEKAVSKKLEVISSKAIATKPSRDSDPFFKVIWDPINSSNIISTRAGTVESFDLRASRDPVLSIEGAHYRKILDIDGNPNKPHHFITAGRDCSTKFWDFRQPKDPIMTLAGHNHWVYNAKFNRFHDQLLITSGSDFLVNLWSISSISSSPDPDASPDQVLDRLIHKFDDHEESVYGLEWSACDAWVFASLSHDGRVVFNRVPQSEKYKILL